jgi:beta-glucanase (GH16 family)
VEVRLPTRCPARGAGNQAGALVLLSFASALSGCGSREDLIIGSDDFTLQRRDDFDEPELDFDYWELATHTFDANLAWFTRANAKTDHGLLVLSVTADPAPATPTPNETPKPYSAAELRTRSLFLYGRFRASARLAPGRGIVSAFWGFYDRYAAMNGVQLDNQIVMESGIPRTAPEPVLRYAVNVPEAATTQPAAQAAGFDPASAFHTIGYDWTPTEVRFYVDGQTRLVISGAAANGLTQYERLVLSAYPSQADWLSAFDAKQLPVSAEFDWVEIYAYNGPRP